MYPYLNIGSLHIGTFGLLLWLAAVCGTLVLHRNFLRHGIDADALNIVSLVVVSGILGAKAWHELQSYRELIFSLHQITAPGWHHPIYVVQEFLYWFRAGFAWFGGMVAGIAMLLWQGRQARPNGLTGWWAGVRMLDLATPAAAIGYGVGRIGCLTSGDGDYGIKTTLPWGVHMSPLALVPTRDLVQPTPAYEFLFSIALAWLLWKLGANKSRPIGWLTGVYLVLSGLGRFLVEFVRINPKLYWGMSNAQVAALGTVIVGGIIMAAARKRLPAPMLVKATASA